MCGIVGYVGTRQVPQLLLDGLKRLEYRGYDSCGIAFLNNGSSQLIRAAGRVQQLEEKLNGLKSNGHDIRCGIGHTRWATHGRPTETNAHPHLDCSGQFLVAHNGIIENYLQLKRRLSSEGHVFRTETDTEILPHLIESRFSDSLERAVLEALREVEGVYGLVAISPRDTQKIVAARKGAPLVIGRGSEENFVASDASALLPYTRFMHFLNDGEIAVVRSNSVEFFDAAGSPLSNQPQEISWQPEMAEKENYPHFMLKEIFEQPRAVRDTLRGRLSGDNRVTLEDELGPAPALRAIEAVKIVACGTSLHAGLVGKFMIEELARIPVEVDYASEFRYRKPVIDAKTLVVAISQSGETADTLAAISKARDLSAPILSVCNVVGSMVSRQSDHVLYTRAGPEIGVASTKAFTTQLVALELVALHLAALRGTGTGSDLEGQARRLRQIPELLERVFEADCAIAALAERLCRHSSFLYLGRGTSYPIALEGALKLKEISYIHAEGYPAGEMKHGPIALIDREMPVVVLAPRDEVVRKTLGNIEEIKVRDGIVVAIATEGDGEAAARADHVLHIPPADPLLHPLLSVVPLQLLAYHIAALRGCDIDKPRNLAKSVTVE
jgi:glucosamine--fructose-6-phosphate aminotransferase (isomerizing)